MTKKPLDKTLVALRVEKFNALDNKGEYHTLDAYQAFTRSMRTTNRPDSFEGACYVFLKLAGEAGEVADELGKVIREEDWAMDSKGKMTVSAERKTKILDEMGDALYYLSEALTFFGLSFDHLAERNIRKLVARHEIPVV
jgi:NTP pyrophosphatase (non-canonical NTP hydrolase)